MNHVLTRKDDMQMTKNMIFILRGFTTSPVDFQRANENPRVQDAHL